MKVYVNEPVARFTLNASSGRFPGRTLELVRRTAARQERQVEQAAPSVNTQLTILTTAVDAFLHAATEGLDPIATVFAAVPQPLLTSTVQAAHGVLRPMDFDFLDLLEPKYLPLRSVAYLVPAEAARACAASDVKSLRAQDGGANRIAQAANTRAMVIGELYRLLTIKLPALVDDGWSAG